MPQFHYTFCQQVRMSAYHQELCSQTKQVSALRTPTERNKTQKLGNH